MIKQLPPCTSDVSHFTSGSEVLPTYGVRSGEDRRSGFERLSVAGAITVRLPFARILVLVFIAVVFICVTASACGSPNLNSGTQKASLSEWVTTTDPPSSISVMLPSQPRIQNTTTPSADGEPLPLRQYSANLSDGRGEALFQVVDAPDKIFDLDKALEAIVSGVGQGATVTSSRHFDLDGHPALDSRVTGTVQGSSYVLLIRLIGDRSYLVAVLTDGPIAQQSTLDQTHQQILRTLHLV